MNNPLGGIAAGIEAAANSFFDTSSKFKIGDILLTCPVCGHDEFTSKSMLMNTSGMSFIGMDWLNASACALVCNNCSRIELFAETPSER